MEHRIEVCYSNGLRVIRTPGVLRRTLAVDESWLKLYMAPGRDQAKFYLAKGGAAPEVVMPHIADR